MACSGHRIGAKPPLGWVWVLTQGQWESAGLRVAAEVPAQRRVHRAGQEAGGRGQLPGLLAAGQDSRKVVKVKEGRLLYRLTSVVSPTKL